MTVYDGLPGDVPHGWKFIKIGPDGKLYVPVGAPCNICEPDLEKYAQIRRINLDGTGMEGDAGLQHFLSHQAATP